ncbi:MAG: hypothetical protein AAGA15_04140 [Pseudomonadota bacterium]
MSGALRTRVTGRIHGSAFAVNARMKRFPDRQKCAATTAPAGSVESVSARP